ncbi:MAG: YchJ family metal-binding protein [Waddliaceae bacterium]
MDQNTQKDCPCCSGLSYEQCCQRYHRGSIAENALILMRSRFAAYAVQDADYIIKTTHPKNPGFKKDLAGWKKEILRFTKRTDFLGLTIADFADGDTRAAVTFHAELRQTDKDASFTEKSYFEKVNEKWLYRDGVVIC